MIHYDTLSLDQLPQKIWSRIFLESPWIYSNNTCPDNLWLILIFKKCILNIFINFIYILSDNTLRELKFSNAAPGSALMSNVAWYGYQEMTSNSITRDKSIIGYWSFLYRSNRSNISFSGPIFDLITI